MAARREGLTAFALATTALVLAAAFTAWAVLAPSYSSGETVWQVNTQTTARAAMLAPLLLAATVWALLRLACSRGVPRARQLALGIGALLMAFSFLSAASVGLFVLPGALLLWSAALVTPVSTRRGA